MNRIIIILIFQFIGILLTAQTDDNFPVDSVASDSAKFLVTDNVEVIKAFEAKLGESEMVNIIPEAPEIVPVQRQYEYEVTIIPYEIQYPEPIIRPISMRKDEPSIYKNWSLQAGYGNLSNAYGKFSGHHQFNDRVDWRLQAEFENANDNEDINLQQYSAMFLESAQDFNVLETAKLATSFQIGREARYFYYQGPDRQDLLTKAEGLRNRDQLGFNFSFFNAYDTDTQIDYKIDLSTYFTRLSDLRKTELNTLLQASTTKTNSNNLSLTLAGGIDYNKINKADLIAFASPEFSLSGKKIIFDLGLSYIYANEKSNIFPKVEIGYSIDEKILQAFAGVNQIYQRNNFRHTTVYNPFASGMDSLATNINLEYYGGVKGDIFGLIYQTKIGYKEISDLAIYNIDYSDRMRRIKAATTNLNTIFISGSIELPIEEWISIGGNLTQNFFSGVKAEELWGIPSLEFNAFANLILLDKKVSILPNLFLRDRINALNESGMNIELDDLIDFNLEVQFNPMEYFGIWLKGFNLFDKRYRRWYGYDNFGIHFQGGISARF